MIPCAWMIIMAPLFSQTQPASAPADTQPASAAGFLYKTIEVDGETFAYGVFVPPDYTPEKPWPVILFLHGSGERGSDGFLQTAVGLPNTIRRNYRLCPAIVVMPQCRPNRWWDAEMLDMALKCLEQTSREVHLDAQRVYLTGLSMGGAGAWELAARLPDAFAAVAPICGFVGRPDQPPDPAIVQRLADRIADLPIWCAHGAVDTNVIPEHSRAMTEALEQRGAEVHYTEYRGVGHRVWDRAYGERAFWRWLFEQRRKAPSDQPEQP